jgi:hypothetical protein
LIVFGDGGPTRICTYKLDDGPVATDADQRPWRFPAGEDHGLLIRCAIHLLVEIEVKGVERALGVAKARELVPLFEQTVLPPAEFVGDEGGNKICDRDEIETLRSDLNQAATDSQHVQELVNESQECLRLGIDCLEQFSGCGILVGFAQQVNGLCDLRQRV